MSNWSKSKKLTVTTSTSGTPKNTSSRHARGAARRWWSRVTLLRRDELVPLTNHVAVLVHQRVPAGDLAHALPEGTATWRSEEHTSELQSPFLTSYAVFCLKK